jgi:hypothetical protein
MVSEGGLLPVSTGGLAGVSITGGGGVTASRLQLQSIIKRRSAQKVKAYEIMCLVFFIGFIYHFIGS